MWTLFPMNPVMRRLGWGVFLLPWPLNLGDGQWMTLVTGLAGSFLLLLALWRLRDAVGLAYSAALLTETGEELVSQRHLIDQGGKTRQLKNAAHPLGRNAAGTVIPAGRGTQRRGYLAKSFRLNSREPTTVSLYVQLVHQSRFINLPYQPPLSLCAPHGASSGPEGPFDQLFTDLPISYEPEGYTPPEVNV